MIFAVLTCISLVVLGFSWFMYRRNIELFLCMLIALYFEFFYLAPPFVGYKYLLLPIIFVLLLVEFIRGRLSLGRYGWWVIWFLLISVFGVFVARFSGQDISLGIKAAKFIPLVMVYFLLAGRKIDTDKFFTYFIFMGLVVAFLATISSFTHGSINFFPGIPKEQLAEQSGRLRITAAQYVIAAATVVAFARYQQSSRKRFLLATVLLFGEILVVQQTRGFMAATFLSMFVVYMLSHQLTMVRISLYMIFTGICLASLLLLSSVDFSSVGFVKRTERDVSKHHGSYGGSLQARLNAYGYYWGQLEKQPITGRGMLNFNWEGSPEYRLQRYKGIHLSDIGIFDFLVQAGLIGFIWLSYGLIRIWKDIWRYRMHISVVCYFIIGTFTMPTLDMFLRADSLFLFAVFLGMTSNVIMTSKPAAVPERA